MRTFLGIRKDSMKSIKLMLLASYLMLAASVLAQDKHEPIVTQSQTATGGQATSSSTGQASAQTEIRIPRQAPAAVAPDAFPSAPCRVGFGGAASAPIGGLSIGGSKLDEECDKRETARAFAHLGFKEAALKILCTTKAAKKALGEGCYKLKPDREWTEENSLSFPK
jgi:hypothetical protein